MHPAALDGNLFRQAAAATAQADEVHVLGQVVALARPGGHVVGNDVGLDHHMLAHLDVGHAFADGIDHARELMAHGDGRGLARYGVRVAAGRNEDRPLHELVQVGAADAAPGDVDADGAGGHGRLWNVFDADVAAGVEACCFHGSSSCAGWKIGGLGGLRHDALPGRCRVREARRMAREFTGRVGAPSDGTLSRRRALLSMHGDGPVTAVVCRPLQLF